MSTCTSISMWKERYLSSSRMYRETCRGQRAASFLHSLPDYVGWWGGLTGMLDAKSGSSGLPLTRCVTVYNRLNLSEPQLFPYENGC